jgi:bifunctional non-homologous end joining protein LigD
MDRVVRFGKRSVTIAGADQVLYPATRFTKEEVVGYYVAAAPFILPHLRGRPVSLKRFPEGIHGESFWEKDAPGFAPEWVKTVAVPRRDTARRPSATVVIDDRATLAWVASVASLEIHPFLHSVKALDTPKSVVFDLDPGEGSDMLTCIDVALLLKDVLDRLELAAFPKVSGSKGLQVHVPLNGNDTYRVVQPFAKAVAELLAREHPRLIVADMSKALRKNKVFIDWSQNADHKTTVAVYSLRAKRHRPYVSMPMTWEELRAARKDRDAKRLDIVAPDAILRMRERGDLFAPVLTLAQRLPDAFVSGLRISPARPRSLDTYEEKRHFDEDPEPRRSDPADAQSPGRAVAASSSRSMRRAIFTTTCGWNRRASCDRGPCPKGCRTRKASGVLAVNTEDHPLDYLTVRGRDYRKGSTAAEP